MSGQLVYVLCVLAIMLALFVSNRVRLDLVALMGLLALTLGGVISTSEALAGFAEPVVLMIAALFVVGAGLFQTGVADALGRQVERLAGHGVMALTAVIMLVTAILSAFLSSTGTVAVMLPVVLAIARRQRIQPSRLLMPVAFAALLGGMLTLIGTPPNLIVSDQLDQAGLASFGFFDFTGPGLVMLVIGMACMLVLAPRLIPERAGAEMAPPQPGWAELFEHYGLQERLVRLRVPTGSMLASADINSSELRSRFGVTVVAIVSRTHRGRFSRKAEPGSIIRDEDLLHVVGRDEDIEQVIQQFGLKRVGGRVELPQPVELIDALVPPRSHFIGRTLRDLRLHSGSGVTVLAQRVPGSEGEPADLDRPLASGDALLMTGNAKSMRRVARSQRDLVLLGELGESDNALDRRKAPVAIGVLLLMMLAMTFGWMANVTAVLLAAVALVVTRCVSMDDAYRSINFEAVVLIAAILPMATALNATGGLELATGYLLDLTGDHGPLVLMAALFVFTAALSQIVSNTATTVLVAPIAIQAALTLDVNPHAIVMTVAIAASAAFATPVASPVNTLVYSAGNYRFTDFARVGIPLQILLLIGTLLVVPFFFPL
jgi:di/tricarboxylate transporter